MTGIVDSGIRLPKNFKRYPSQMPCNRVSVEDIVAVSPDGSEFKIYDPENSLNEFNFLKVLKQYGGVSGGVGINPATYTELFHIENEKGGFIPVIVFPAAKIGKPCSIRIDIDGNVTDIEIPPNGQHEWRSVIGGFFPLDNKPTNRDTYAKVRFLERRTVNLASPVEELERGNSGLFFENQITVSFIGDVVEEKHGSYTCFTLLKFT